MVEYWKDWTNNQFIEIKHNSGAINSHTLIKLRPRVNSSALNETNDEE